LEEKNNLLADLMARNAQKEAEKVIKRYYYGILQYKIIGSQRGKIRTRANREEEARTRRKARNFC
jgi:ferritin-like protein